MLILPSALLVFPSQCQHQLRVALKKLLLFAAPLLTRGRHSRWLCVSDLAEFYTLYEAEIDCTLGLIPTTIHMLGKCVNHYIQSCWCQLRSQIQECQQTSRSSQTSHKDKKNIYVTSHNILLVTIANQLRLNNYLLCLVTRNLAGTLTLANISQRNVSSVSQM